jgi:hypothetical protein
MYTQSWEDSMRRILLMIALSALLIVGCGGATRNLQKGVERYERTDYTGAKSQWSSLTTSESSLNQKNLVRYLVYRGLTHYRLGERTSALSYLGRGRDALARGNQAWLRANIVAEMDRALGDLNGKPGAPGQGRPAPSTTVAPAPPPLRTGEALVPIKSSAVDPAPAKPDATNAGPAPTKPDAIDAGPAPAKTAAKTAGPAPVKSTATSAGPAPAKTASPPTKTSPAVQSSSPR